MGLAPYGEPRYVDLHPRPAASQLKDDGSFQLEHGATSTTSHGLTMTNGAFDELFGGPPRAARVAELTQREMDLAASIQVVTEEIMLRMARHVHRETGMENLCLAGGVALNCVGNGRLLREGPFERLWIQPAAGDAGGALGVALAIWHQVLGNAARGPRRGRRHARLVPRPGVRRRRDRGVPRRRRRACTSALPTRRDCSTAPPRCSPRRRSSAGSRGGWSSARARSAPAASSATRARAKMQSVMNLKIKFRESFRPFAPSVLREHVARVLRARRATRRTCCWSRRCAQARRIADDRRAGAAVRHREAERAALDDPGGHARRLLGAHPDRGRGDATRSTTRCSSAFTR